MSDEKLRLAWDLLNDLLAIPKPTEEVHELLKDCWRPAWKFLMQAIEQHYINRQIHNSSTVNDADSHVWVRNLVVLKNQFAFEGK